MAASKTYEPIATNTVSGSSTTSVVFSSISGSYTDLVIVLNAKVASGTASVRLRFNSDTGSNYSWTTVSGNGSAAYSTRTTSTTSGRLDEFGYLNTEWSVDVVNVLNYSNASTYKTVLSRCNNPSIGTDLTVNLWRSTAAITSIELYVGASNFVAGSTFTLYGITAA